jgi:flagellar basal body-associated protein FliL
MRSTREKRPVTRKKIKVIIIIIIIIIFINCNWVLTRWQWSFNTKKHETGLLINLRREGYMRSM